MALVCSSLALLLATACPDLPQSATASAAPIATNSVAPITATFSKQAAILGAPSRLQLMAMQQASQAHAVDASAQQANLVPAAGNPLYQARPAVLERASAVPAVYRWTPASSDRPDVFGTSAVPVAHTSLDAKWRRVTASFASAVPLSHQIPLSGHAYSPLTKLEMVNSWVNHHITFMSDIRSSGVADRWSGAAETLARGIGDCEDYAIAKLQLLKALGFSQDDLYLSIVKDLVRRADHAVLIVRLDGRFFVLDNNVDRLVDPQEVGDYRPVITYAASGKAWLHGYRQAPQVQYASADASNGPATRLASASLTPAAAN
jgi:predicted transglutaminase-like cysteine proteinase